MAVSSFVSHLSYQSPEIAAPWAETLSDDNQRVNQMENIARRWLETDRASAEAWLARVNLPEERKKRLLSRR
jgi:hypothetical protein